ncbi:MAG: hypothetical protein EPO68_02815 [Planctomycetota bacterium]|nr:MAG: hypothetical protein EPO68_02815 [Planctomycetota bacterium]
MSTRSWLTTLAVAAVSCGIGFWFGRHFTAESGSDVVRSTTQSPAPGGEIPESVLTTGVAVRAPVESDPNAKAADAVGSSPASEPGETMSGPGAATEPDPWRPTVPRVRNLPEIFALKYTGATAEQLRAAADKVREDLGQAKSLAFDDRQAAQQFVRRKLVEGGVKAGDGPGFTLKTKAGDCLTRVFNDGSPDGAGVVWLPFESYPEIYFLYDEWSWLTEAAFKAEQASKPSKH